MLDLEKKFTRKKGQMRVAEFLLRNGIRVGDDGSFYSGEVEIASSAIARAVGIDRRVVVSTAKEILADEYLKKIFTKLGTTLLLRDVGPELGMGVIEIIPKDPSSRGIISGVSKIVYDAGISIRQISTEDPMFSNAEMTIVTERPLPKNLIDKMLKMLPQIKKVVVIK